MLTSKVNHNLYNQQQQQWARRERERTTSLTAHVNTISLWCFDIDMMVVSRCLHISPMNLHNTTHYYWHINYITLLSFTLLCVVYQQMEWESAIQASTSCDICPSVLLVNHTLILFLPPTHTTRINSPTIITSACRTSFTVDLNTM